MTSVCSLLLFASCSPECSSSRRRRPCRQLDGGSPFLEGTSSALVKRPADIVSSFVRQRVGWSRLRDHRRRRRRVVLSIGHRPNVRCRWLGKVDAIQVLVGGDEQRRRGTAIWRHRCPDRWRWCVLCVLMASVTLAERRGWSSPSHGNALETPTLYDVY